MPTTSFDDFLAVVDELFVDAVAADAVCLKSTQAYQRTLQYEQVTKEQASAVYGRSLQDTTASQQKQFEDFMFRHICRLSAKYELPFQVHTGDARIQGSSPMLLVDVIAANPRDEIHSVSWWLSVGRRNGCHCNDTSQRLD